MEKTNKTLVIIVIVLAAFCWALGSRSCQDIKRCFDTVSVRVDSFIRVDTIIKHDTVPDVRTERVIRYITKKELLADSEDSIIEDKQDSLPIVQKEYSDDSTYTAYVSGIKYNEWPRLDSINTYTRVVTNTITKTITIKKKPSFFHFGLQVGYGYGLTSGKFEPYVGIGGSIGF